MKYEIEVVKGFENDFNKFIKKLDKNSQARMIRTMDLLERYGISLGIPFVKKLEKDIWELRTSGKQRVRVLFTVNDLDLIILNWFIKKTNKTPKNEIKTAISRLDRI